LFLGCGHGRRKEGTLPAHILLTIWCSRCVRYTSTRHLLLSHVLRPYPRRNWDVARRIYNYRLTRARRIVECAFGIVCNKWTIFHSAIDVCPYFCDVTVKTCCILHNFVRETAFSVKVLCTNVPSRVLRLLAISNVTGTDMGRRAQGTGMSLRWGAWQRASLSGTYV